MPPSSSTVSRSHSCDIPMPSLNASQCHHPHHPSTVPYTIPVSALKDTSSSSIPTTPRPQHCFSPPHPPQHPPAPLSLLPTPSAATTFINIQKAAFPGQAPGLGWGAPGGNVNNGAARDSPLAAGRGDPAAHLPRQISCRSSLRPNFVPQFPPSTPPMPPKEDWEKTGGIRKQQNQRITKCGGSLPPFKNFEEGDSGKAWANSR